MPALRSALLFALFACTGCGSGTLAVYLNSSESEAPVKLAAEPGETLVRAKQVRLTLQSAAVHLASVLSRPPDPEGDAGWIEVLSEPLTLDLINLRGDQTRKLGEGVLPSASSLSQIRLRLLAPEPAVEGWHRLPSAVVDARDRTCDLLIPEAAVSPGLTLADSQSVSSDGAHLDVIVSVRMDDSALVEDRSDRCTWELSPSLFLRPVVEGDDA